MPTETKAPLTADEQESPEPERLVTPQEAAGQDIAQLDDPPQAEGDRDDGHDGEQEEGRD